METKQALLLIDIQNDYFEGGANPLKNSLEASLEAQKILNTFRAASLPVIHIQHLSVRPDSTFFIPGTKGVEIHNNVSPASGEKIFTKNYPNSFRGTDLLDHLKANNIQKLIICGMMTHMCVDSTVRAAKDHGFDCTVIGDACATRDLEIREKIVNADEVQHAFLAALSYFYASVKNTYDYLIGFNK